MGYHSLSYLVAISLSVACGWFVLKKYGNPFGWYFFLFTLFVSSWFAFYFLFFSGIEDESLLLFLARLNFWISVGATWSLWHFVRNFSTGRQKIGVRRITRDVGSALALLSLYSFTPAVVGGLEFSESEGVYRETFGPLFAIHPLLHLAAVAWFLTDAARQLKKRKWLDRIRLKRILAATGVFGATCLVLQLALPMMGVWVLEKEIVFFYLAFAAYVFHTLRRYYFHSGAFTWKYAVAGISAVAGIGASMAYWRLHEMFAHGPTVADYWSAPGENALSKTIVALLAYAFTSNFLKSKLFWNPKIAALQEEIASLERKITGIVNPFDLNATLKSKWAKIFRTGYCRISLARDESRPRLDSFFQANPKVREFMMDEVFLADARWSEEARKDMPEKGFLAFPVPGDQWTEWYLFLWKKALSDAYSEEEAAELRKFALFLGLQLKNMSAHEKLQDMNVNLDKKVDEKTIEYNDLINRQKEFISVISHEIKAPITNAVFQSDGILDDLESWIPKDRLKKELEVLNSQLVRAGDLLTKLFSVQYYETRSVSLFKEKVQVWQLLVEELGIYAKIHPEIRIVDRVARDLWFVEIDRLQFQQVMTNLLQNAAKHSNKERPTVVLNALRTEYGIEISVEDDGEWFECSDAEKLFERYTTGAWWSASLWMGLYLCRIIVEMHGGKIKAGASEEFGGAKFTFTIPSN